VCVAVVGLQLGTSIKQLSAQEQIKLVVQTRATQVGSQHGPVPAANLKSVMWSDAGSVEIEPLKHFTQEGKNPHILMFNLLIDHALAACFQHC
jgi:hypothetical protein